MNPARVAPSGEGDPAPRARKPFGRWAVLAGAVLTVSVCHYLTPPHYENWHVVYQRLYYLPILFGAFWYGLRGGLVLAVVTSVLYLPHIMLHWGHEPLYRANQLAEIPLFFVIGIVAGLLIDRSRREREGHRRTAEELARAYRQLQQTFERLRLLDRLSALGALSAGLAHEIRNPLGSITGSIEILESAIPDTDERREFVGILKKEIQRLSSIVSRHLDLVRSGKPERDPHNVGDIVRSVVDLTSQQAAKQGVRISAHVADPLPTVMVDGQQLRQAILNLVINGIQALPDGGELSLTADTAGDRLRIIVEDDGPGLGEEALRRGFEPFYTTKDGGTGLGLSIAFQIADGHGGDLRAENRETGGARFCMEIPVAAAEPDAMLQAANAAGR